MKFQPINPELFSKNRQRFIKSMQSDSIAIFVSNDEWPGNGDAIHPINKTVICTG